MIFAISKINVLSISTFSFIATLINPNVKKAYLISRPKDIQKYFIFEEKMINGESWIIIDEPKFILNYFIEIFNFLNKIKKYF